MVPLLEGLLRQPLPTVWTVDVARHLQSNVEATAFNRQIKTRAFVLNEVQCDLPATSQLLTYAQSVLYAYLREAFLLQIRDDTLAK